MSLEHCIIHHLQRPSSGAAIVQTLRDEENPTEGPLASLFEQLRQSFLRSAQKQYGHFDRERSDWPLPGWIRDQHEGRSGFASFSQRATEQLKLLLDPGEDPFDAHLIYARFRSMEQQQLYIFWIEHSEANYINSELQVERSHYINSGKLIYAARLDIDEWLQGDSPKYLALLCARGDKQLSDCFKAFISFSAGVDLQQDTSEFLGLVDAYAQALPEEQQRDYRNKVIDFCLDRDQLGESIVFKELSSQLDDAQPEQFSRFIEQNLSEPRDEIMAHRGSLKRYIRFFGRDNQMSISFSADVFGEAIEFDEQTGVLTIKQVPKSLREQLKKHRRA